VTTTSGAGAGSRRRRTSKTAVPAPDLVIGERYRLVRRRNRVEPGDDELWQAVDEILARPVAIRLIKARDGRAAGCLAAAGRAGRLADTRHARVLDAARADGYAFVVTEWIDGDSLGALLRAYGPLDPLRATAIAQEVAGLMTAAHAAGLAHRRLHPENVLVCRQPDTGDPGRDQVRVTDLEVAAVLHGLPEAEDGAAYTDAHDIGRVLYAGLTARWPVGTEATAAGVRSEHGLAAPPQTEGGRPATPRQIRAGIPRPVDAVVIRALATPAAGGFPSPAAVAAALAQLPGPSTATAIEPAPSVLEDFRVGRWRRLLGIALPLAIIGGIAAVAWIAGLAVGRVPGPQAGFTAAGPSSTSTHTAQGTVIAVHARQVRDFDPEGDGSENPDSVGLAVDGDASTAWSTTTYKNRPDLGGLKSGVGLLVDLGRPRPVKSVTVLLSEPGANLELRAGAAPAAGANGYQIVAHASDAGRHPPHGVAAGTVTLVPQGAPLRARYWLIWLTRLPRSGSGYADGIAELTFRR
jgi:hypothetical protein